MILALPSFQIVERVNFVVAILLNILALTLIFTKSRKEINEYRKLLIIFLVAGAIFAILHALIQPTCVIRDNAFITFGSGWLRDARSISFYFGVASISFLILAMHYVYRALVITRNTNSAVRLTSKTIAGIIAIILTEQLMWTALIINTFCYKPEYEPTLRRLASDLENLPHANHEELLVMYLGVLDDHSFNWRTFGAIIVMISLCGLSFALIVWSTVIVIRALRDRQHRSSSWRKYNRHIFVALCLQFLGPLILLYIPCVTYILLPFVPFHAFHSPPWLLSLLYSLYPIVDPLVIIVFIGDYRRGLLTMLRITVAPETSLSFTNPKQIQQSKIIQVHPKAK